MPPNWNEFNWNEGFWDDPTPPAFPLFPSTKKPTDPHTMASNPTPDDNDVLLALAEDMADGCHLHEVTIGIKQNTEAVMRAGITASKAAIQALGAANVLRDSKYDALHSADDAGTLVLKNCRLRLVKVLGSQYNSGWQEAGWPGQSTAIPDSQDLRFTLLGSLDSYFTAHPTAESVDMEATAAICHTAHETLSDARSALNTASSGLTNAKKTLAATLKTMRKRVRGLIDELGQLIADDDGRYADFGLSIPANPVAPEAITQLTATAVGGGKLFAKWNYATRLVGTRLKMKRVGVDDDFVAIGTVNGLEKMLEDLTPGQTILLIAIAYNDGGDAQPSPVAQAVVT
jgi:hypothetical protein